MGGVRVEFQGLRSRVESLAFAVWGTGRTGALLYKGTSLIRSSLPVGTYSSICLGPYGGPGGRGLFLMSEVPFYSLALVAPSDVPNATVFLNA